MHIKTFSVRVAIISHFLYVHDKKAGLLGSTYAQLQNLEEH